MKKGVYERKKSYKEVWEEIMTTLANCYGLSDVALGKQKMGTGQKLKRDTK